MNRRIAAICLLLAPLGSTAIRADVALNNLFTDHMVLQQGIQNKIWGKADPGEEISVSIAGQSHTTVAKKDGSWSVQLDSIIEYGGPHTLTVEGNNTQRFEDVLIGEVWVLSLIHI